MRLILVGALAGAISLSGCCWRGRQQETVLDQSWYQTKNHITMPHAEQDQLSTKIPVRGATYGYSWPHFGTLESQDNPKIVSPNLDPPPLPERKPEPGDKLNPFGPTSFSKKPPESDPATVKPPGMQLKEAPPLEPVTLAFQCILDNRPNEALKHLKKYDAPTQEFFIRLLPPIAVMCKKSLEQMSPGEIAALHEQLQSLDAALRNRAELLIDKMCFCEWVRAYGVYEALPAHHGFTAGSPTRPGDLVQLYVELRNFASEPRDGEFETRLASTVVILDPQGRQVWFKNFDDNKKPYRSKTLLHDYYNNYSFSVPHLPPGNYTLKLQVVDEIRPGARRVAHKTMDFRVSALPRSP